MQGLGQGRLNDRGTARRPLRRYCGKPPPHPTNRRPMARLSASFRAPLRRAPSITHLFLATFFAVALAVLAIAITALGGAPPPPGPAGNPRAPPGKPPAPAPGAPPPGLNPPGGPERN